MAVYGASKAFRKLVFHTTPISLEVWGNIQNVFARLALEICKDPWLLNEQYADLLRPMAMQYLQGKSVDMSSLRLGISDGIKQQRGYHLLGEDGKTYSEWDDFFAELPEQKYVLYMPIQAVITKYSYCGVEGNAERIAMLSQAEKSDKISGVVLLVDSGGGSVGGTKQLGDFIKSMSKPTVALVDGMAASAAYWIASACDKVYLANEESAAGSVGAVLTLVDPKGAYEKEGYKFLQLYATQSTRKNEEYRAWTEKNDTKMLQNEVDKWCSLFIDGVKANRPQLSQDVFSGPMFMGQSAIDNGLVDGYSSLESIVQGFFQSNTITNMKVNGKERASASLTPTQFAMTADDFKASNDDFDAMQATYESVLAAFGEDAKAEGFNAAGAITKMKADAQTQARALEEEKQQNASAQSQLATAQTEVADLKAQLDKKPGATTTTITNKSDDFGDGEDPNAEFLTDADIEAREMYKSFKS